MINVRRGRFVPSAINRSLDARAPLVPKTQRRTKQAVCQDADNVQQGYITESIIFIFQRNSPKKL